jgi:tetratricopeptide (TPR) repeat protein
VPAKFLALTVLATATAAGARPTPAGPSEPTPQAQASAPTAPSDLRDREDREVVLQGIRLLMDGDPDAAIEVLRRIQREDPQSPLGYLFEADATWWKIYLTTGDLIDPDVFDVARSSTSPYDSHFEDTVDVAIRNAAARARAHDNEARNILYEGLAYGLRGRFFGLRDNDLPTARAGKRMRVLFLKAIELDPSLADAYLGLGTYNYFVDTLPAIVKLLKFLIALPGGSRELGLQQLRLAAEKGELVRDEARFYLAKDFSRGNEKQYARSLELFQGLARDYPDNTLWTLLEGSLEIRLGHVEQGERLYRQAYKKTAGMKSEVGEALHAAARRALARRHPSEKFE